MKLKTSILILSILFFSCGNNFDKGNKYLEQKKYREAITAYEKIRDSDEYYEQAKANIFIAYYFLGSEFINIKQLDSAMIYLIKVDVRSDKYKFALSKINYCQGLQAYNKNNVPEAVKYFEKMDINDELYFSAKNIVDELKSQKKEIVKKLIILFRNLQSILDKFDKINPTLNKLKNYKTNLTDFEEKYARNESVLMRKYFNLLQEYLTVNIKIYENKSSTVFYNAIGKELSEWSPYLQELEDDANNIKYRISKMENQLNDDSNLFSDSQLNAQEITIEKFTVIPNYIFDCSCFFYSDKSDSNKRYIFACRSDGDGCMKIDGKMQKLKRIMSTYENGIYLKLNNSLYEVEITGKRKVEGNEWTDYEGKITVRNIESGAKKEIKFVGGCGC